MVKVAVILSGCGFQDGSEIHEAVLTLLALDRAGAVVTCLAPDIDQERVVDHERMTPTTGTRNVLTESARIARGRATDIARAEAADFDAVVLPGGYGAALNLCTFATDGPRARVDPGVARFLLEAFRKKKVIGAWCIAPALLAAALREEHRSLRLTIGDDAGTAQALESMGAKHVVCQVEDICIDEANRIVTTPAYMFEARIGAVAIGIDKAVAALVRLAR